MTVIAIALPLIFLCQGTVTREGVPGAPPVTSNVIRYYRFSPTSFDAWNGETREWWPRHCFSNLRCKIDDHEISLASDSHVPGARISILLNRDTKKVEDGLRIGETNITFEGTCRESSDPSLVAPATGR